MHPLPPATSPTWPRNPAELAREHSARIYRFAAMVARGSADSEDIAQDALVRAMRSLDRFDPAKGAFEAWLWRIVVNIARDAGRATTRRHALADRLRSHRQPILEPDVAALQRIDNDRLLASVRALRPRPRTVIALRFGAGLSYAEIGDQLGLTPSAAQMATRRALGQLRQSMENHS